MLFGSRLKKRFISLTGLAVLGLAVHFLDVQRPQPAELFSDVPKQAEEPDYYTVNSTYREYNAQGVLSRSIQSERLLHYPDSEQATLEAPVIITYNAQAQPEWELRARQGQVEGDGDFFRLQHNVRVWQNQTDAGSAASDGRHRLELFTEQLDIDLTLDQASTEQAVQINTPQGTTHAVGMLANLKTDAIELKSQVRSVYPATNKPATPDTDTNP